VRIYLAGEREGGPKLWIQSGKVKRRLYSYFYHNDKGNVPDDDIMVAAGLGLDLFLDSGAFSAFTKKVTIDPKQYAKFIEANRGIWTTCSSLDAIGSGEQAAQASYDNLKTLEQLGVRVQPVFHVREPEKWLQRYIDEGYDYIFIGGMVPETTQWLMDRLDVLWDKILVDPVTRKARVKVHGFGLTDQKLMFKYPWFSVDSSSWLMTGIFGSCVFRPGHTDKLRKVVFSDDSPDLRKPNSWHYKLLPQAMRDQVDEWLIPYGVTAAQCGESYYYRDAVNSAVFQSLEDLATETFAAPQETLF
jgi:hypothetical protein